MVFHRDFLSDANNENLPIDPISAKQSNFCSLHRYVIDANIFLRHSVTGNYNFRSVGLAVFTLAASLASVPMRPTGPVGKGRGCAGMVWDSVDRKGFGG